MTQIASRNFEVCVKIENCELKQVGCVPLGQIRSLALHVRPGGVQLHKYRFGAAFSVPGDLPVLVYNFQFSRKPQNCVTARA